MPPFEKKLIFMLSKDIPRDFCIKNIIKTKKTSVFFISCLKIVLEIYSKKRRDFSFDFFLNSATFISRFPFSKRRKGKKGDGKMPSPNFVFASLFDKDIRVIHFAESVSNRVVTVRSTNDIFYCQTSYFNF